LIIASKVFRADFCNVAAVPTVELQLKSKAAPNRALELDRVRVAFVRILITLLTHQKNLMGVPNGTAVPAQ
jgi:hypothetical protein